MRAGQACRSGYFHYRRSVIRLAVVNAPLFETPTACGWPAARGRRARSSHGVDLAVGPGEIHAVMGPNGSGKSTLAHALMGSPEYQVTGGHVRLRGDDVTDWDPDVRAKAGMFLAFQYPQTIAGRVGQQLPAPGPHRPQGRGDVGPRGATGPSWSGWPAWKKDPPVGERYLNEGFSGGEKKRNEILQLALLQPDVAILDETDSGLDVDALRVVAKGVQEVRKDHPEMAVLVITHYQRLLDLLPPDRAPPAGRRSDRRLRRTGAGGAGLEAEGYESWR